MLSFDISKISVLSDAAALQMQKETKNETLEWICAAQFKIDFSEHEKANILTNVTNWLRWQVEILVMVARMGTNIFILF